ncbi:hypothetical protein BDR22DRAFT_887634 [Usnea florida]
MSTSSGSTFVAVNQTVAKIVGPPYRKRAKNAVLNDPSLLRVMGTMEKALDFEEFPVDIPCNLDDEDRTRWVKIREALFDQNRVDQAAKNKNPKSFVSFLAHARQALRMLQDVSAGTRAKFEVLGCAPKPTSRRSKFMSAGPATKGIAKAKRTKTTQPRGRTTSQREMNPALYSISVAAQDGAANAMDLTPADNILESIDSAVFETPEQRVENDRVMTQMAVQIRQEHPALRDISPDTMSRIAHFVDMGIWEAARDAQ